jgi:hypothetical protein
MKFRQSSLNQRGLSLIGLLLVAILAAFVLFIGVQAIGPITEYLALKRVVGQVAGESGDVSDIEIRRDYERRIIVEQSIKVTPAELSIRKERGEPVIEVAYERKVPLVANVSLAFDFRVSSRK